MPTNAINKYSVEAISHRDSYSDGNSNNHSDSYGDSDGDGDTRPLPDAITATRPFLLLLLPHTIYPMLLRHMPSTQF